MSGPFGNAATSGLVQPWGTFMDTAAPILTPPRSITGGRSSIPPKVAESEPEGAADAALFAEEFGAAAEVAVPGVAEPAPPSAATPAVAAAVSEATPAVMLQAEDPILP